MGDVREVNFTGKKMDPETGLYYFNQRYYDPTIGRFLTEDPAGQAYNPYLYASNNPLMYVDPDGEFWWVIAGAAIGAIVANWGKPVTFENTLKGAVVGAIAAGFGGAAMGLDTMAVNWGAVASIGGISLGVGGTLGMLGMGAPKSSTVPDNLDQYAPDFGEPMGGGNTKGGHYYEDPGTYLPGSGPGMGVAPGNGEVESSYKFRNGRMHTGVDFRPGDGVARSRFSGRVAFVGEVRGDGYGLRVIIANDLGFYSQSSHLAESLVSQGERVFSGDPVGYIGKSGGNYMPHLHYEEFEGTIFGRHRFYDPGYREKK